VFKSKLRKKILKLRQKFNTKTIQLNFRQIVKILKKEKTNNQIIIGGYFPVNYEIDDLEILKKLKKKNIKYLYP
jgi:5-formyltetrahydrofolate cyclo-ligase